MSTSTTLEVTELGRDDIRPFLPTLDEWLLPGCAYSVHHTWPLLYRSDGHGRFFVIFDGDQLISHCATRDVALIGAGGPCKVALLGSVATHPEQRGRGLAGQVLERAIQVAMATCEHIVLWAERPELYRRLGFADGQGETCLLLARTPTTHATNVRAAQISDHEVLHRLHQQKPWRVDRTFIEMSGLLTTPGMATFVLERDGAIQAYACCGKGADLVDHWHEVGGEDACVAELLGTAMHLSGQLEAMLLLPPYRPGLRHALGRSVVEDHVVTGPMAYSPGRPLPACWVDGLDSV